MLRGCGDEAQGDLVLEHQGQAVERADPVEPAEQQRRCDVVGQVGDDLARGCGEGRRVEVERVAGDDLQPAGKGGGKLAQCRKTARVALDRDDMGGAFGKQRAGQPAGAGADLDDVGGVERTRGAGDAARQVEVEEEVLAEPALGGDAVPGDDLAQRRQRRQGGRRRRVQPGGSSGSGASPPFRPRAAARRPGFAGRATPLPAMSKAVP